MARSRSPPSVALSQPPVSAVTASGLNARGRLPARQCATVGTAKASGSLM